MFSIDEINNEVIEYKKYTQYNMPLINNVKYDLNGNELGEIRSSEYEKKDEIILHLNSCNDEYPIKFQKSILWHEFTHLHDIMNNQDDDYMKTISEIKATSIKDKFLLSLKINDILNDTNKRIIYMNYSPPYQKVLEYYNSCAVDGLVVTSSNGNPRSFNYGMNNLMYLCGGLKNIRNKKEEAKKFISKYPDLYKKYVSSIINYLFTNCKEGIIAEYKEMRILTAYIGISNLSRGDK